MLADNVFAHEIKQTKDSKLKTNVLLNLYMYKKNALGTFFLEKAPRKIHFNTIFKISSALTIGNFHRSKKTCFALWDMALPCACARIGTYADHIRGSSEMSVTSVTLG